MREKILVVDGDPSVRELLRIQLRALGFAVEVAEDAIEAGHSILHSPPDLLLCAVGLPYLSGPEFVRAIRADRSIRRIPVVFMVELDEVETHAAALADGEYLTKPLHYGRTVNVVARQLELRPVESMRQSLAGASIV